MLNKTTLVFKGESNFNEILPYIQQNTLKQKIKNSISHSEIELIRVTIIILSSLVDIDENSSNLNSNVRSSFQLFRQACE